MLSWKMTGWALENKEKYPATVGILTVNNYFGIVPKTQATDVSILIRVRRIRQVSPSSEYLVMFFQQQ